LRETSCLWSLQKSGAHKIFGRKQSYTYAICTYFGKFFELKKTALPSIKKLNENIGRIFGCILKFSKKVGKCEFLEFVKNVNKIHNIFKIIFSNIISADNIKSKILTVIQT
jgi:hypothetical protein